MSNLNKISINEEKLIQKNVFPLTLSPPNNSQNTFTFEQALNYIEKNKSEILENLLKHGAILFRGFPVESPKDFNDFALKFGWEDLPYIGGAAVRNNVYGVVFTSNESPPDQPIPFHHEMAQVPKFPSYLFFFCDTVPKEGGETPLCLSNAVFERINQERPEFVKNLMEKNVRYTRILPEEDDPSSPIGRGWKSTYLTNDKTIAEQRCLEQGTEIEWLPNGCLKTVSKPLPAIKLDPRINKYTWFNSIVAVFYGWRDSRNLPETAITYGDGTPINSEDIERTSQILDELSVSFKWQKNDVVLIDNRLVLHARKTFTPPRRILAALFQ